MAYDDQTIECLERDRWQDEEIDRRDAVGVVREKRPPALGRWPPAAAHIPSDRRLGDLEAELEQLTMNAWGAPQRIRTAHLANERTQLTGNPWSADPVARSPAPIRPETGTVPAHDRFRSNNRNRAEHRGEQPIKPNEQKSIRVAQVWMFRHPTTKHIDLLPEDQDFSLEICPRFEKRGEQPENQLEQIDHQATRLRCPLPASMQNLIFGTHTYRMLICTHDQRTSEVTTSDQLLALHYFENRFSPLECFKSARRAGKYDYEITPGKDVGFRPVKFGSQPPDDFGFCGCSRDEVTEIAKNIGATLP